MRIYSSSNNVLTAHRLLKNGIFTQLEIAIKNGNIEALDKVSKDVNISEIDENSNTSSEQ